MAFPQLFPFVASIFQPTILQRGPWATGRPTGVTVHHAADRDLQRVLDDGVQRKVGYHLIVDRAGLVHQAAYMDQQIAHAGIAMWNGHSPNRNHVAVCVLSWGEVAYTPSGFIVWAKGQPPIPGADCALRKGNLLGAVAEWWDACPPAQEAALVSVLRWLVASGINPANVCGHDEAALPVGRKNDPGGALSLTMSAVRSLLMSPAPGA